MPTTVLTVAIPYVNADPHLGYAYELVLADVVARARRQAGEAVRFSGGTDDYSLKNVIAADRAGADVRAYVEDHAQRFAELADTLGVSFDDFVRTSADGRHRSAVERLWRACAAAGDLYRRTYVGDYCVGCEQFWRVAELVTDESGRRCCPEHLVPLERVAEENWFFRLSRYGPELERLIKAGELTVEPAPFRDEVLAFIRSGLDDISVSRSVGRARGWGIGVPGDPGQVIYVWYDALANYLTSLDFGDPTSADVREWWCGSDERAHVVGKGIVRFHAVYWPAFLLSAGVPLPTRIQVHPYLTAGGAKLSKSAASPAPAPADLAAAVGVDALRWWFASAVSPIADTDFTTERLVATANAELAGGIGNVVSRVVALARRGGVDLPADGAWPLAATVGLERDAVDAFARFDLRGGCRLILDAVDAINRDLETSKPWTLRGPALDGVLRRQAASLRLLARALAPVTPDLAARVTAALDGDDLGGPVFARLTPPAGEV